MPFTYQFARPSVTATVVIINPRTEEFCVGIRSKSAEVHPSVPCCPGGFMDPRIQQKDLMENYGTPGENPVVRPGETVEQCAIRELVEEVNLHVEQDELKLFYIGSSDQFDPRAHVVNACFYVLVESPSAIASLVAGDDIEDIKWYKIREFMDRPTVLAFNHGMIARRGIVAWYKEKFLQRTLSADDYRTYSEMA